MKSICVFCGSNFNGDPQLFQAVEALSDLMVQKDITLVYGGGRVGVMGLIANQIMEKGGKAIGAGGDPGIARAELVVTGTDRELVQAKDLARVGSELEADEAHRIG